MKWDWCSDEEWEHLRTALIDGAAAACNQGGGSGGAIVDRSELVFPWRIEVRALAIGDDWWPVLHFEDPQRARARYWSLVRRIRLVRLRLVGPSGVALFTHYTAECVR